MLTPLSFYRFQFSILCIDLLYEHTTGIYWGTATGSILSDTHSGYIIQDDMSNAQCYYPNGQATQENDIPCTSGDSACCPSDWTCLNNGLCYNDHEDYLTRFTCTDKSWNSTACPQICLGDSKSLLRAICIGRVTQ